MLKLLERLDFRSFVACSGFIGKRFEWLSHSRIKKAAKHCKTNRTGKPRTVGSPCCVAAFREVWGNFIML
eukprot:6455198-Amphidinium_carterae.1